MVFNKLEGKYSRNFEYSLVDLYSLGSKLLNLKRLSDKKKNFFDEDFLFKFYGQWFFSLKEQEHFLRVNNSLYTTFGGMDSLDLFLQFFEKEVYKYKSQDYSGNNDLSNYYFYLYSLGFENLFRTTIEEGNDEDFLNVDILKLKYGKRLTKNFLDDLKKEERLRRVKIWQKNYLSTLKDFKGFLVNVKSDFKGKGSLVYFDFFKNSLNNKKEIWSVLNSSRRNNRYPLIFSYSNMFYRIKWNIRGSFWFIGGKRYWLPKSKRFSVKNKGLGLFKKYFPFFKILKLIFFWGLFLRKGWYIFLNKLNINLNKNPFKLNEEELQKRSYTLTDKSLSILKEDDDKLVLIGLIYIIFLIKLLVIFSNNLRWLGLKRKDNVFLRVFTLQILYRFKNIFKFLIFFFGKGSLSFLKIFWFNIIEKWLLNLKDKKNIGDKIKYLQINYRYGFLIDQRKNKNKNIFLINFFENYSRGVDGLFYKINLHLKLRFFKDDVGLLGGKFLSRRGLYDNLLENFYKDKFLKKNLKINRLKKGLTLNLREFQ